MGSRLLAEGIGFTEGPLWTDDGRLLVVAMSRGLVVEIDLEGGVVDGTEVGGGPNGLAEGPDGMVWVAQNGGTMRPSRSPRPAGPGLQRLGQGEVHDVPVPGALAPNDLVTGPDGRLWFTDPGLADDVGRLCAHDPVDGTTSVLLDGLVFPNGLAFGPEGDVLHLADTAGGVVTRHRWTGERLVPDGPPAVLPAGGPDGLAVDADGRLHAAAPAADAVFVFAPDGRLEDEIDLGGPAFPTNLCFAGPGLDVLVVTAARGGRVLVVDRPAAAPQRPLTRVAHGWRQRSAPTVSSAAARSAIRSSGSSSPTENRRCP
ncbi:SMP-30/gluconolactonase/LRE family protein [Actinomycetospora lutea]|uniref:SMP-30/gluconolactonase/LRE family protein n=1 Tax=Actinomycetospora lutea TaxID=663604 RepID=UPI002365D526|nr:SMP-30/gluconolactonase/LRE family protein [Actinomycetospora lutea]MDD7939694.1 SMP-30/gluconolactonase/LRE family protein [Actinomycetospora lutea]